MISPELLQTHRVRNASGEWSIKRSSAGDLVGPFVHVLDGMDTSARREMDAHPRFEFSSSRVLVELVLCTHETGPQHTAGPVVGGVLVYTPGVPIVPESWAPVMTKGGTALAVDFDSGLTVLATPGMLHGLWQLQDDEGALSARAEETLAAGYLVTPEGIFLSVNPNEYDCVGLGKSDALDLLYVDANFLSP